ncbi:MAG: aminoglycoside phosphotransferase family protein [Actinomycetota bacterium]|nr:aminoglycoside phosphotransferase family protein [Actinomycetota bacterium]
MDPELPYAYSAAGERDVTDPVAAAAAAAMGLPAPTWRSTGMNAVYEAGDAIVRVGFVNGEPDASARLAGVLAAAGIRVPAPLDIAPFSHPNGMVVTAWERLAGADRGVDWAAVGAMVARLHDLDPGVVPDGYPLPWCGLFPWWRLDALLEATATDLDRHAAEGLQATVDRYRAWSDTVDEVVVCHGDVHRDNVVMTSEGPALIDWDLLCRGPREWDHAPMMRDAERWGGEPGAYEAFATGYGASVRGDGLGEALAELRLVAATLMRIVAGHAKASAAEEAQRRLRYWRGDPDAPMWIPS